MTLPEKPKTAARRPRGLEDRTPASIRAAEAMMETIRKVYSLYGFEPVETPFLEYTDALGKFLPDQDRPNAGVFSLKDDDGQWMSLRYDLTAPLARYVAENWQNLPKPYRSYRAGYVFRNEKPGPGRFRQFMQFDADTVGSASLAADAEICMMAADTLEALGIPRGQYVIKVNNRKVLDGLMTIIGLGGEENSERRLIVLRALDKSDKFDWTEISKLLGSGRWDGGEIGKGDFTKGAGLSEEAINGLELWMHGFLERARIGHMYPPKSPAREDDKRVTDQSGRIFFPHSPLQIDSLIETYSSNEISGDSSRIIEGLNELKEISDYVRASGYGTNRIYVDLSVVRGLEYYTGPVFEAELLFDTTDEDGKPVRFGSVGGGGRYDGLVSRFLDEPVPATGFSIGVSRLLAALQALGKVSTKPAPGPVVVLAMDKTPEAMASYQAIVADLRRANIPAELYLGSAGMKAQLKYADRRHSTIALIQGSNEREAGMVQVKDLILGATLTSIKDRTEYLAKQAEAQVMVPVADVVDTVRKVLARQG